MHFRPAVTIPRQWAFCRPCLPTPRPTNLPTSCHGTRIYGEREGSGTRRSRFLDIIYIYIGGTVWVIMIQGQENAPLRSRHFFSRTCILTFVSAKRTVTGRLNWNPESKGSESKSKCDTAVATPFWCASDMPSRTVNDGSRNWTSSWPFASISKTSAGRSN